MSVAAAATTVIGKHKATSVTSNADRRRRVNVLALGTYGLVKHRCSGTARDP